MSTCTRKVGDPSLAPEIPLFERAQAGCPVSLGRLMERHSGLVQAVVRQQFLGDLPFAEALQAGHLGLWRAILRFDPQRGWAFSTYAWPAIMRHVWRAVKDHGRQESRPSVGLLASDTLADDPVALTEAMAWRETLYHLVERLPQRLRQVVVAYYGLAGHSPASYRQLGVRWGLSHERIRQLHTEALVWLSHPAHSQALRALFQRHRLADYEAAEAVTQRWLQRRAGHRGY